jgi:hypothetical protein
VEETGGLGHRHEDSDLAAAARLPEDGDVARISAEPRDVVADPLECEHHVEHPDIARVGHIGRTDIAKVEVAERVEPVADRDDHDVVARRQSRAVIAEVVRRTGRETAAVQPDEHRARRASVERRSPDMHPEAILAVLQRCSP